MSTPARPRAHGFVSLVGAGPGVKDFLTVRALDRIERADLILYDALVDASLLELAPEAQRFYVGKRAGQPAIDQRTIEALLIRHARQGRRVVRLKAGDPFVLGRGGEEALALEAAGVPYEVVPGLSTAPTAAACAGIPATHRGLTTSFVMVSGHAEAAFTPLLSALPAGVTVMVLMGFGRRDRIASVLLNGGWSDATPAAFVAGAGTSSQHTWRGTLGEVGREGFDPGSLPVTMIIGATAALQLAPAHSVEPVVDMSDSAPSAQSLSERRVEPS